MFDFSPREALQIRNILEEAKALMELEAMAQSFGSGACDAGEFHGFVDSAAAGLSKGGRFRILGSTVYGRINSVHGFSETGAELFAKIFPQQVLYDVPSDESRKIETRRRPYSVQISMDGEQYYCACNALKIKKGFTSSNGLCLYPDSLKPDVRDKLGGSVFFARTDYFPVYQGSLFQQNEPGKLAFMQRSASAVTERHEEVHAWQNLMRNAGYLHFNGALEQDLLDEESASCISSVENCSQLQGEPLLHTNLYAENDITWGNFVELAAYIRTKNPQRVIEQRKMNANALVRAYEKNDPKLGRLVGWALHLMDFYRANRALKIIPAVYETM